MSTFKNEYKNNMAKSEVGNLWPLNQIQPQTVFYTACELRVFFEDKWL